jgi:anti-sigma regulatory factor (Ser/Thr protein kinase)
VSAGTAARGRHAAGFVDGEHDFGRLARRFTLDALADGAPFVLVARPVHTDRVVRALTDAGADVRSIERAGRFVAVDAVEVLSGCMTGAHVDPDGFDRVVGGLVDGFGDRDDVLMLSEMVSILCDEGAPDAVAEIEALTNDLGRSRPLSQCCIYRLAGVLDTDDLVTARRVCDPHDHLMSPPNYRSGGLDGGTSAHIVDVERVVLPVPEAIGAVRRFVATWLRAWRSDGDDSDAVLMASELVTNAVRHTAAPFRVRLQRRDGSVVLSVEDMSVQLPVVRAATTMQPDGRGVALVQRLSNAWGVEPLPDGKVVWVEFSW